MRLDDLKHAHGQGAHHGAKSHVPQCKGDGEGEAGVGQEPLVEEDDGDRDAHPHEHIEVGAQHLTDHAGPCCEAGLVCHACA
eukprot:1133221-Pelagomonas_calceolata.AAC.10